MRSISAATLAILTLTAACEKDTAKPTRPNASPVVSTTAAASAPVVSASSSSETSPAASASSATTTMDASVLATAAPIIKVDRTGKAWPFHAWNRAEAFTFNQFAMRPGVPLVVYNDINGWSPSIVDRKPITEVLGKKAVDFVFQTNGDVEVSKCPFPRHAVVLYEDTLPVASINVCFSCGDILVWPPWDAQPDWSKMSDKQMKERLARQEKQMKLYDKVFPKWKAFFRDEVGFSIESTYH